MQLLIPPKIVVKPDVPIKCLTVNWSPAVKSSTPESWTVAGIDPSVPLSEPISKNKTAFTYSRKL